MSAVWRGVMEEGERQVNRSCVFVARLVLAVGAVMLPIGLTGAWSVEPVWMYFYLALIVLPLLAIVLYAERRDCRGAEIKYLMIVAASLIPASMAVPTLFGFTLMPLPIVVAGRYFSRSLVWKVYLWVLALTLIMMAPHARFGTPSYPLCEEARGMLQLFLDGRYDRLRYLRYLLVCCFPSFAVALLFFAFTMSRLCADHRSMLDRQAEVSARLADVEKGLAIAAAIQVVSAGDREDAAPDPAADALQPDVREWSTKAIADCIARVKRRAAEDPAFAALVARDPSSAVREVQS